MTKLLWNLYLSAKFFDLNDRVVKNCFALVILFGVLSIVFTNCAAPDKHPEPTIEKADMNRFTKVKLAEDFDEPMEMVITKESKVILVERPGNIKMYSPEDRQIRKIGYIPVFHGQEDGLLGIALDPLYNQNNYVYLFYSPPGETPLQRVSRFELKNDSLYSNTEKQIIDIPTQRKECCHSSGSLAFGPDNNLYISVGDNTNPHNPGYYNSVDERKGREYWDAQRTAGNTNDLRGKILRIRPKTEGGYTIPEGNLFPEGMAGTRPEIYVMGCRNPFRFSLDAKRGWLFWGDVGQNTVDDPKRGPISYDEWNVARKAGFFGWPYFAGPNAPYAEYDFATGKIGPFFNPSNPVNKSVNNTGLKNLPPAQSAMIWYSYDESKVFKHLGTGGKSPIAGPVYYSDAYVKNTTDSSRNLPNWYDGKLFIAEWIRNWINVVTLDSAGKVDSIEQFMPSVSFNHPINLEMGPDGVLYVLEYGSNWLVRNKDAGLYRIEYNRGKMPPAIAASSNDTAIVNPLGNKLFEGEDCMACHALNQKSVGPSFMAIADRYPNNDREIEKLAGKVISGGSGVWGQYAMSAHPQLSLEKSKQLIKYILSLKDDPKGKTGK
jgi:cytochrome c